jgi:hypothetical protein
MPEPQTCYPTQIPPHTLIGGPENIKLLFDDTMSDISINRKSLLRHQDGWESLCLRNANFSASFDHMILANMAISGQTGDTSAQQTTSPIRTGIGDDVAAGATPQNRATDTASSAVAAGIAESVQTNVTTQVSALTEQILALGGTITTGFQALTDSNASIAASLAVLASALTALKPTQGAS